MSEVIPTAQNLDEGFCPTDWQTTLDGFAAAMRVTLPDEFGMIIISTDTPDPDYNGRIWFKVDDDNHILGIYSYDTDINAWVLADPFPYYFTDIGTDSALAITTGEDISLNSDIVGRFFMVKVAATNTNTTVTFGVDSAPAAELRKYGTEALVAGDLKEDMVAILLFDGTYFQLLNPAFVTPPTSGAVFVYQEASGSAAANIPIGDTTIPLNGTVTAASWAILTGNTVEVGEGTYFITATIAVEDDGSDPGARFQFKIKNGGSTLNWQDGAVTNVSESTISTVNTVLSVGVGVTASITAVISLSSGQTNYCVDTGSSSMERPASLTILKLS